MRSKLSLYFLLGFLILSATSTVSGKPKWVKNRPISDIYYIGIARVATNQTDYIQLAKNKALTDIISEISVELSSTSVFHQLEKNNQLQDTYESWTKTKIKDELEGYELVDTYTKKGNYWVYYKLSIATYQRIKQEKLDKAKSTAKSFLESALEAQKTGDIGSALTYYQKSFDAIEAHLREDLSIFIHEHGRIDLGSFIYSSIQNLFSKITFKPSEDSFSFIPLSNQEPLIIKAYFKNDPAKNLPLLIGNYSSPIASFQKTKSNANGDAPLPSQSIMVGTNQQLKVIVDLNSTLGLKSRDNPLRSMFSQATDASSELLKIKVGSQSAIYQSNEITTNNSDLITASAKKQLGRYLFSEVSEDSNAIFSVVMTGKWNEDEFDERYGLYKVSMDFTFSIYHIKSKAIIYQNTVTDIKGMKNGSYMKARNDALAKLELLFKEKYIPEINLIKVE